MKRFCLIPLLAVVAACPRDKKERAENLPVDTASVATAMPADTPAAPGDISGAKASLPTAAPDTFRPRKLTAPARAVNGGRSAPSVPEAPAPLLDAVQREQAFSRFCFTEFGQKADPSLRGNVAMVVTVAADGISDARVGDSNWSGSAGGAVDRCLNDKARRAWKLSPGAVPPGRYVVHLSFTGS